MMTEETKRALLMAGMSAENIAQMEGEYKSDKADYRDFRGSGPQGRQQGNVYTAANPMEHLGHFLSGIGKRRNLRKARKEIEKAKEGRQKGRRAFSEAVSRATPTSISEEQPGPWKGGLSKEVQRPSNYEDKIAFIREQQAGAKAGIGHGDPQIAAQAAEYMRSSDNEINTILDSEENKRTQIYRTEQNKLKEQANKLKEQGNSLRALGQYGALMEKMRHNQATEATEKAKLDVLRDGEAIKITAGELKVVTDDMSRLNGIRRSMALYKDAYSQTSKLMAGFNIPGTADAMKFLTLKDVAKYLPGISDEDAQILFESAEFFASWASNFTLPVRNQMFGATLTPSEARAWKSALELDADSPPEHTRRVMARLEEVTKTRMKYRALAAIEGKKVPEDYFDKLPEYEGWRDWSTMTAAEVNHITTAGPTPDSLDHLDAKPGVGTGSYTKASEKPDFETSNRGAVIEYSDIFGEEEEELVRSWRDIKQ